MNAQERVAHILCRLMDDEWELGEQLYRNRADEIIATLAPAPNVAPREAGEAAFYECEGNNEACLKAAFDAYEAANAPELRAYMHQIGAIWRLDNYPAGIDFSKDGWVPLYALPALSKAKEA